MFGWIVLPVVELLLKHFQGAEVTCGKRQPIALKLFEPLGTRKECSVGNRIGCATEQIRQPPGWRTFTGKTRRLK